MCKPKLSYDTNFVLVLPSWEMICRIFLFYIPPEILFTRSSKGNFCVPFRIIESRWKTGTTKVQQILEKIVGVVFLLITLSIYTLAIPRTKFQSCVDFFYEKWTQRFHAFCFLDERKLAYPAHNSFCMIGNSQTRRVLQRGLVWL